MPARLSPAEPALDMRPTVSVLVCTYNRSPSLARVLSQLAEQRTQRDLRWDIVIVDNNSTDDTAAVVQSFAARSPDRFKYVFVADQGKSRALNRVIPTLESDILAFTDDDVDLDQDWLDALTRPLSTGTFVGAAGRIIPKLGDASPRWLRGELWRELRGPLVMFDLGDHQRPLQQAPYGANMAFRRDVFQKYGLFRTDLGPIGNSLRKSEDIEFASRVIQGGDALLYVPDAIVHHPVPKQRMRRRYYVSWWFNHGRETTISEGIPPHLVTCFGVPRYLARAVFTSGVKAIAARDAKYRVSHCCRVAEMCGRAWGVVALRRNKHA